MDYSDSTFNDEVFSAQVTEETEVHNHEMNLAWQYIANTNMSVFLTGKAGTGKTTFLKRLRELSPKRMVVLAPTGVAAINCEGQTIHSFFQLPLGPNVPGMSREEGPRYRMSKEKKRLIRTLDLLVIDEISMVRCDTLDAIDTEMRKYKNHAKPFGGAQLLMIGDLQQLAPVAQDKEWAVLSPYYQSPYFFCSHALSLIKYTTIELQHIYRQQDEQFIDLLAHIRENRISQQVLNDLNRRCIPQFQSPDDEDWIRLTTHNKMAQDYNNAQLEKLTTEVMTFDALTDGTFPETSYPCDYTLTLKEGAQVMFLKNDTSGQKAYYNGKIGVVKGKEWDDEKGVMVIVVYCKENDTTVMVPQHTWENTRYVLDEDSKEIKEEVEGTFTQYPLRLAWAITVHKSQGLTFDHAVLDINSSFTHGQVYVALSRCRTLEGLVLSKPISYHSIISDQTVNQYVNEGLREGKIAERNLPQMKRQYYITLLDEMFDYGPLREDFAYLTRVVEEHLSKQQPELLATMKQIMPRIDTELTEVATKFQQQYIAMVGQSEYPERNLQLQTRLQAAFAYFKGKLKDMFSELMPQLSFSINNEQVSKQYNNALEAFFLQIKLNHGLLKRLCGEGKIFTVKDYLTAKAQAVLDDIEMNPKPRKADSKGLKTREKGLETRSKGRKTTGKADRLTIKKMYHSGLTEKQIATRTGLSASTVESLIVSMVVEGEMDINDVVAPFIRNSIEDVVDSLHRGYTLKELKDIIPLKVTFLQIKCVLALRNT